MPGHNKHGLTRDIPEGVARAVRQRCGFGCVLCGKAVYSYHHFNPSFADARDHRADGITLLCPACHQEGSNTQETIVAANAHPCCRRRGYTGNLIQSIVQPLSVRFGSCQIDAATMIMDEDTTLMGMSPAEEPRTPPRLDAALKGDDGAELLSIVKNEWRVGVTHFDITVVSNRVEVRRKPRDIILAMTLISDGELQIERLHMCYKGFEIDCSKDCLTLKGPRGGTVNIVNRITAPFGLWFKGRQLLAGAGPQGGAAVALE